MNIYSAITMWAYAYTKEVMGKEDARTYAEAAFPIVPQSSHEISTMFAEYVPAMLKRRSADLLAYLDSGDYSPTEHGTADGFRSNQAYDDPDLDSEYHSLYNDSIAGSIKESVLWFMGIMEPDVMVQDTELPRDIAPTAHVILHEISKCLNHLAIDLGKQEDMSKSYDIATEKDLARWRQEKLKTALDKKDLETAQVIVDWFLITDLLTNFSLTAEHELNSPPL